MKKNRAFLISFEGIEGAGKSTQCQYLINTLREKGLRVAFFREPGSSVIGEKLRRILLYGKGKLLNFSELLLFMAARAQLVSEKIRPNLNRKDVIILDRYIDATVAYQGYAGKENIALIKCLNKYAVKDLIPDLTLVLDIQAETGLGRCGRKDCFEKRSLAFHRRVRRGYLRLARENPRRIKVISADADIQAVQERIRKIVCDALNCRRKK